MLPLWVIVSILAGLLSNVFNILSRYLLRDKDDSSAYAWYLETVRFAVLFLGAILFDWKLVLIPQSIVIFLLLGLTDFIAIYLTMKTHAYSHISISAIVSRTRMIWVAIIAFILVGEQLKTIDYIGIAILFFGVSIISAPKKWFVDKGLMYANGAAIMIALSIVIAKMALPYGSPMVVSAAYSLPSIFLFPLFMKGFKGRVKTLRKTKFLHKTVAIAINLISLYLFTLAMQLSDNATKVNAIYQGMLIVAVIAGILLLKERENTLRKLAGTAVTLAGVLILSSN